MPAAFSILTNALAVGALSDSCLLTMDAVVYPVGCIMVRRQEEVETGVGQVFVVASPKLSFRLSDLPRRPQKGDVAVITSGADAGTWTIGAGGIETGSGMIECPVIKAP